MFYRLDRYIFGQITIVTLVVAAVLTGLMVMMQSLRFLDLIITSGASGLAFITLTLLALPRFFEVILPVSLASSIAFIYWRLRQEGELTVMRGAGLSPARLARPGLILAGLIAVMLWVVLGWMAPTTLARMQDMRQIIKTQYSTALFREGVFNAIGDDVTLYIARRLEQGGLEGLMIYDARAVNPDPVTVLARAGKLIMTPQGQQVLVYNGSRQVLNSGTEQLQRLQFDRYTIDLPDPAPVRKRWAEPEERTLTQLWALDASTLDNDKVRQEFVAERHRRFLSPLLALSFAAVTLAFVLLAPFTRTRRLTEVLILAVIIVALQGGYITAFSLAKREMIGVVALYLVTVSPLFAAWFALSNASKERPFMRAPRSAS